MRSRFCLRFIGAGAFLLVVVLLLSNGAWGEPACPHTKKHYSKCPEPATTVDCSDLGEAVCDDNEGQYKLDNYWTCKSALESNKQCLEGTEERACWMNYDCEWSPTQNKCKIDVETQVIHKAVLKIEENC